MILALLTTQSCMYWCLLHLMPAAGELSCTDLYACDLIQSKGTSFLPPTLALQVTVLLVGEALEDVSLLHNGFQGLQSSSDIPKAGAGQFQVCCVLAKYKNEDEIQQSAMQSSRQAL